MLAWPHDSRFPHRGLAVVCICSCALLLGMLTPGLGVTQRPILIVATFTGVANGFFFGQILTRLIGQVPMLGRPLLVLLFYLSLASGVMAFWAWIASRFTGVSMIPMHEALAVALFPAAGVGWAAAAYVVLRNRSGNAA